MNNASTLLPRRLKSSSRDSAEPELSKPYVCSFSHYRISFSSFINLLVKFIAQKVLIANNGIAAVKCMRSIRRWSYEVFKNEKAIKFVAMYTPEDLKANAGKPMIIYLA